MAEEGRVQKIRDVSDLEVFRKAYMTSLEVHTISLKMPRHEQYEMARQIRRASKSICANLAEGFGKQSVSAAEFKRFIQMALGSADEMQLWLTYCNDLGYMKSDKAQALRQTYKEIARMLNSLHKKWT